MGARRIQLYVDDVTRRELDALPADLSRSEILRVGLAAIRADRMGCHHHRLICRDCGSRMATSSARMATPTAG